MRNCLLIRRRLRSFTVGSPARVWNVPSRLKSSRRPCVDGLLVTGYESFFSICRMLKCDTPPVHGMWSHWLPFSVFSVPWFLRRVAGCCWLSLSLCHSCIIRSTVSYLCSLQPLIPQSVVARQVHNLMTITNEMLQRAISSLLQTK